MAMADARAENRVFPERLDGNSRMRYNHEKIAKGTS
jgi:hypothetical protein